MREGRERGEEGRCREGVCDLCCVRVDVRSFRCTVSFRLLVLLM